MISNNLRNAKLPKKFAVLYYAVWLIIGIGLAIGGAYYMANPGHGNNRGNVMSFGWLAFAFGMLRIISSSFYLWKMSKGRAGTPSKGVRL